MKDNYIYGSRPVIEAIQSGKEIEKLLIQKGLKSELHSKLLKLVSERSIPYQFVPVQKLNRVSRKNHQGVIAYVSLISYQKIEDVLPLIFESGKTPFVLILDGITDVRNLGAIARTAECAGVDTILIPEKGSAQVNPDAMKTSSGALNKIPVCREKNLKRVCVYLKDSGIKLLAASEKASRSYYEVNMKDPLAMVMGSEEKGVGKEILDLSDDVLRIPMLGGIQSLNVSVAAGIMMFECLKQRS
ncbi:MAG: 23S rRNA (guanosine(2251)-2'-O)-methyltransferase RlmB [Bacteroidales bacterium]|nr:23S rRNA (guanosine(2251)-2'-O)-methyltransferase RlmB [Bacteroidales bacterium]MCF8388170.1 23S rRNA (guanosine(2251)-2'-O)-methyltransferase RlmB [Bacteroidales bacterium]MCF8399100.1 23S rRNA (guanosine(2251)-2'-O)-methyltransferase RlmB [Bacteroidales bacterium]